MAVSITSTLAATIQSSLTATTVTWTNPSIGTAAADRIVAASIAAYLGTGSDITLTGLTIGGIAATQVVFSTQSSPFASQSICTTWIAPVPTGTTATVVATGSGSGFDNLVWGLALSRVIGADLVPASSLGVLVAGSKTISGTLVIPTGGAGFGVAVPSSDASSTGYAWTNLTEISDGLTDNNLRISTAQSTSAGSATRSAVVTTSESAGNTYQEMNLIAFQVPQTRFIDDTGSDRANAIARGRHMERRIPMGPAMSDRRIIVPGHRLLVPDRRIIRPRLAA